jgi:acetyl-CoA carboxylase beta subunit
VTVRGILTHSSGLPRESDFPYWTGPAYAFPPRDKVIVRVGEQEMLYRSDLEASLWVTPSGRHMRIDAPTRLRFTFDDGKYEAVDTPDVPEDPLKFSDGKSYKDRLNAARKAARSGRV